MLLWVPCFCLVSCILYLELKKPVTWNTNEHRWKKAPTEICFSPKGQKGHPSKTEHIQPITILLQRNTRKICGYTFSQARNGWVGALRLPPSPGCNQESQQLPQGCVIEGQVGSWAFTHQMLTRSSSLTVALVEIFISTVLRYPLLPFGVVS